jgi:outer membrane biosynthesis protein TonB
MIKGLSDAQIVLALAACALSFATGGCAKKTVHAAAPVAAPVSAEAGRPMNVAPDTDASPPPETVAPPPTLPAPATPQPAPVTIPAPKPAAPRRPAGDQPPSEAQTEPAAHAPAPQISPQLSPTDQASYARKIGEDTSAAEKNLEETSGKQLNAAQLDLVGKIRSFLSQSREASRDGDWARAQNLAQKARLLSNELINSF